MWWTLRMNVGLVVVLIAVSYCSGDDDNDFKYDADSDDEWKGKFERCGGHHQSPIVIDKDDVVFREIIPVDVINYHLDLAELKIENNGHTVEVELTNTTSWSTTPKLQGAMLDKTYGLKQFHFHWGQNDSVGSEHEVGAKSFPLEMHLVHTRDGMLLSDAADNNKEQTIAVLAVLFEMSDKENGALQDLIEIFSRLMFRGTSERIRKRLRISNFLPGDVTKFYTYNGSLTTPPCSEDVSWIVLNTTSYVSDTQLSAFRSLFSSKEGEKEVKLSHNYRRPQHVSERKVYTNVDSMACPTIPSVVSMFAMFCLAKYAVLQ